MHSADDLIGDVIAGIIVLLLLAILGGQDYRDARTEECAQRQMDYDMWADACEESKE
jgi:hypothetical protein